MIEQQKAKVRVRLQSFSSRRLKQSKAGGIRLTAPDYRFIFQKVVAESEQDYRGPVEIRSRRQTNHRREKSGKHRRKGERQISLHIESRQQRGPLVRLCPGHYAPQ